MFKNIVSSLSFSPQSASQLVYYARRLRGEGITRRFSAIAMVLVVGFQVAAVLVPPTSSNAASSSDVIFGGLDRNHPVQDLLHIYDQNHDSAGHTGYQQLFTRFNITRAELAATTKDTISFSDKSIYYLGRNRHDSADQKIVVAGETYYLRHPYTSDNSRHDVLRGKRADGSYFAVDIDCGNIIIKQFFTPPPPPPPAPVAAFACTNLTINRIKELTYTFTATAAAQNTVITGYIFEYGDTKSDTVPSAATTAASNHVFAKAGTYTAKVRVTTTAGTTGYVTACSVPLKVDNTTPPPPPVAETPLPPVGEAKIVESKSALNTTQNQAAEATPARAGDTVTYTLATKNTGTATEKAFVVSEELNDVLEYASMSNLGGGVFNQSDGTLRWAAQDIAAGATANNTFAVVVKSPIPDTAVSASDPYSFDMRMDNIYGNAIKITLAKPLPKQIEATTASLPQTGAGASTTITLSLFFLIAYFYARSRQLAKEVRILRVEHNQGV